jgi:hypothetical protein
VQESWIRFLKKDWDGLDYAGNEMLVLPNVCRVPVAFVDGHAYLAGPNPLSAGLTMQMKYKQF